jgi:hypothetical protein
MEIIFIVLVLKAPMNCIILQVAAMKEYYEALEEVNANEITLAKCNFIEIYVIPNLAAIFIVTYWITGLLKYNYPESCVFLIISLVSDFIIT